MTTVGTAGGATAGGATAGGGTGGSAATPLVGRPL